MYKETYMVKTAEWNKSKWEYVNDKIVKDLTGCQAMKIVADFLNKHPETQDGNIFDDDHRVVVTLRAIQENGDEYWLSVYKM